MLDERSREFFLRAGRAARLLSHDLVRMQPSALKHTYLSAVANLVRHTRGRMAISHEGQVFDLTRAVRSGEPVWGVGFADPERTLPLAFLQETTDKSIRHVFVPDPRHPVGRVLTARLQGEENRWARERDTRPRDLRRWIIRKGLDHVCHHGLPELDPEVFTDADHHARLRGDWYPTGPLPGDVMINHRGRPNIDDPDDWGRITDNVLFSVQDATGVTDPVVYDLAVVRGENHTLGLKRIDWSEPPPENPFGPGVAHRPAPPSAVDDVAPRSSPSPGRGRDIPHR